MGGGPTTLDPHSVSGAVESLLDASEILASAGFWQLPADELVDALTTMETAFRRLFYGNLRLLAEIRDRNIAGEQAQLSIREFLQDKLRLSPAEASRRVHAARELLETVNPSGDPAQAALPTTATGVAEGALSAEHAQVISEAVRRLPVGLDPQLREEAEQTLATHARNLDPSQLRLVARRLHLMLAPDDTLEHDKPARRELFFRRDIDGMDIISGRLDPEGSAKVQAALAPLAQPYPTEDGIRDPRSPARRRADALVELVDRALDSAELPVMGGEKPHVTVTIRLDDLRDSAGYGILNTGVSISAESARRIACDAQLIPVVLGSRGEPLDVGRASRSVPPGIRRAVVTRDVGCVHPGCRKTAAHSQIHHVRHWADGGPTAVGNLALLCPKHHWVIHHEDWRITFLDGIPHVIPPPIIDPLQRPRRNTMHDG